MTSPIPLPKTLLEALAGIRALITPIQALQSTQQAR